jgi:hypothetical protein
MDKVLLALSLAKSLTDIAAVAVRRGRDITPEEWTTINSRIDLAANNLFRDDQDKDKDRAVGGLDQQPPVTE